MPSAISNNPPFVGVRIPDELRKKVNKRIKGGGFETMSEYIRDLIRRDVVDKPKKQRR
jgi:Arc/MetJ-type ribon-helix-helix transcriptional regulator